MVKKLTITLFFLIIFSFQTQAQEKCNQYSEPSIGVTFCAPPKWTIKKDEAEPFAEIFGETNNIFTPNINVKAAPFVGSLAEVTTSGIQAVLNTKEKPEVSKIEVISKKEFATAYVSGFKVVYEAKIGRYNLRSIQYFFKGEADIKIVVTATLHWSEAEVLEPVIDEALKTFKVSK